MNIYTTLRKTAQLTALALLTATFFAAPFAQNSIAAEKTSTVTLRVDAGGSTREVVIELDETNAPKTSANFKKLAAQGFYDGIAFHRVISNYIVQAGDPLTKDASQKNLWGTGGAGYTIQAEIGLPHERGSIAMARLGDSVNPKKASSGSQFYIALARIPKLDREYTVFGKVISGLDFLDQIASSDKDSNNNPSERVEIVSASVAGGVMPTVASAAPAAMPKTNSATAPKKEAGSNQVVAETKKESWFKRKFGKKKDDVAVVEEPMPVAVKAEKPAATVASNEIADSAPAMEPKKESWFKRKLGKKKSAEVEVEEPMPVAKSSSKPAPTPSPKPAPEPASIVASNDSLPANNGDPTYRNDNSSDSRSAVPAQPLAADGADTGLLSSQMKTAAPDDDDNDVQVGADKDRGLVGRFLYRYW